MEKTGFCDVICGSELFSGCFWTLSFSGESAMNMLVTLDSKFFHDVGCGSELFSGCFWTLFFSGESAAEYAGNSGL